MSGPRAAAPARRRVLAAGAAALLAAGCAGTGPDAARVDASRTDAAMPPRVRERDRWRYEAVNRFNGAVTGAIDETVAAAGPRIVVRRTLANGPQLPDEVCEGAWNVVQEPSYDVVQVFDAPVALVPFGAPPGSHLNVSTRYRAQGDERSLYWSEHVEVVGWESVEVPGGRFDCLRIERVASFQHRDYARFENRRFVTIWYAPAANRWVRRTWRGWYFPPGSRFFPSLEDWVELRLVEYAPAG